MSPRLKFFGLGLAVGALVVGMIVWRVFPHVQQSAAVPAIHSNKNTTNANTTGVSIQAFDWRSVESEDYRKYIANLRAIGCPEQTIRDIITADVNKLFEDRRKDLLGVRSNRFEYWKSWTLRTSPAYDEAKVKAQQELANERRTVLKALLGAEPEERLEMLAPGLLDEIYDFLGAEKRRAMVEIDQRLSARRMKLASENAVAATFKDLEKERDAEVATLLSPEEFEEYQLRRSDTANKLATDLIGFEPTEQEFRDIFRIRRQLENEFGTTRLGTLGSAATAKMDEELKTLLGDSRYTEYERSQEVAFRAIYLTAVRNGLGREAAGTILDLRKTADARANAVRQDPALSSQQREIALSNIRSDADNAARSIFSKEAMTSLEGAGFWLGHVAPPTTPAQP